MKAVTILPTEIQPRSPDNIHGGNLGAIISENFNESDASEAVGGRRGPEESRFSWGVWGRYEL